MHRILTAIQPIDINYNRSVVSVFEGTPVSPSLSYQFALGGIGSLRELSGRKATSAGLINQITATHSILLPFGATIANRYQLINARNWTLGEGDRTAINDGTQGFAGGGPVSGSSPAGDGATSADIQALGDRIGAELERQARTIQTMQRQMVGA
jgi:hypothetical protein